MHAAVLQVLGKPPRFEEFPEPTPGEGVRGSSSLPRHLLTSRMKPDHRAAPVFFGDRVETVIEPILETVSRVWRRPSLLPPDYRFGRQARDFR